MKVNVDNDFFTWGEGSEVRYTLKNYNSWVFYEYGGVVVSLPRMIDSGWTKEDFVNALTYWESIGCGDAYMLENIDKFLNEIIIKSIIE